MFTYCDARHFLRIANIWERRYGKRTENRVGEPRVHGRFSTPLPPYAPLSREQQETLYWLNLEFTPTESEFFAACEGEKCDCRAADKTWGTVGFVPDGVVAMDAFVTDGKRCATFQIPPSRAHVEWLLLM